MSTTSAGAFGAKVEEYMERLGMQQNELAKKVGLSPSHLSRIVKGTRKPPRVGTVRRMVKALRLTEDEADDFCERAGLSPLILQKNNSKKDAKGVAQVKTARRKEKQNQRMVGQGQELTSGTQVKPMTLSTIGKPAVDISDSLGVTGEIIEYLIASAHLSEEEEKQIAVEVIEFTKRLLALRETLRKIEEG